MADNIPSKIKRIKRLAEEYFTLPDGALIEKHTERLRIAKVENSNNKKHPHIDFKIYITRRSIKHFVERRKADLSKNHEMLEVLTMILFAAEQTSEVIINFDKYEYEVDPEKYIYTKHYPNRPSVRIVCEQKNDSLEICSMHFSKQ